MPAVVPRAMKVNLEKKLAMNANAKVDILTLGMIFVKFAMKNGINNKII